MLVVVDEVPFEPTAPELLARLRLEPGSQYAPEVEALLAAARRIARPRAAYRVGFVRECRDELVVLSTRAPRDRGRAGGSARASGRAGLASAGARSAGTTAESASPREARFASRVLAANLGQTQLAFAYVATCGRELDSLAPAPGDVFAQFVVETIKEMALWAALTHLYQHLSATYHLGALASMNPGSGEARVWPIEQQRQLFAFLGNVESAVGVVLTESCLMVPNKSVSGIFFPSEEGFENCHLCRQERCPNRRAPFDEALWARLFPSGG